MSKNIFKEIEQERAEQDEEWGGPAHDDGHSIDDWRYFIDAKLQASGEGFPHATNRKRLLQIAALAVAAIEVMDRADSKETDGAR